jgi:alkanesulfonate monooxygenase SsuD/methylene tetrahydromethanopterin reductase-like flavin-dependent oxidoreductase (luciferase family)
MTTRGFGIAGSLDHAIVRELAIAADAAGYATFWANDTPQGDGLAALRVVHDAAPSLRLGVGVIPIDRVSPADIAERMRIYGLPEDSLTIGIGSGGLRKGAVAAVEGATTQLHGLTTARIVVGALGPKMVAMSAQSADGALLNWLTPKFAAEQAQLCHSAAPLAWVGAYVRVATGEVGIRCAEAEGARYAEIPAYKAHFERMGVNPAATCALGDGDEIQSRLADFDVSGLDETVVRAISATETLDGYLAVLHAAAPNA